MAKKDDKSNLVARDFMKKYKLDLIEIPQEFKDIELEEDYEPARGRKGGQRKRVYTRSSKSLVGYDAWRCVDRQLVVTAGKEDAVCKMMIPPALLKRAFGTPDSSDLGWWVTGQYDFEDANLDVYRIMDYKKTDLYHGLNREDEWY